MMVKDNDGITSRIRERGQACSLIAKLGTTGPVTFVCPMYPCCGYMMGFRMVPLTSELL
jgi:hypothetical protein